MPDRRAGRPCRGLPICGAIRVAYNSCRNRHCPKCQGHACREWLAARQAELLPVPYFHVVFTLPAEVAEIAFQNKAAVYAILFKAAAETLRTIAADPRHLGAEIGLIAVLHSWGQNLHLSSARPLHRAGRWRLASTARAGSPAGRDSSCPCACCRACFAGCFLEACERPTTAASWASSAISPAWQSPMPSPACSPKSVSLEWVVYAKPPFGGPNRYWPISAATPIASPSPIPAWSAWTTNASRSAGGTIAMAAGRRS